MIHVRFLYITPNYELKSLKVFVLLMTLGKLGKYSQTTLLVVHGVVHKRRTLSRKWVRRK